MDTTTTSYEIDILHQKVDRYEMMIERPIGPLANHFRSAITPTDPPNASLSTNLHSQAHIVQPTQSVARAKIAINCPDHLKDTLKESEWNICSKIGTIDETDRKKMPESIFEFLSTGFLDFKQKPIAMGE